MGAVSLGFSPSGTRIRKKVIGRTKTEVRDKLKELHKQVESGLRPRRRYKVGDALDDWLAVGMDGLSARTVICTGTPSARRFARNWARSG